MNKINQVNNYLMPIFTAIFSITGLIYFEWGVFHIVYLYWFENLVKIFFNRLKVGNVEFVEVSGELQQSRAENGKIKPAIVSIFTTRLFMYFVYFIFIVIGLGFILPFVEASKDDSYRALYDFVRIFTFKDWQFNLALLTCLLDELMSFYRDFKLNKKYSARLPYKVPMPFSREDVILHLSILTSIVIAFLLKHPESPLLGFTSISPMIISAVILIMTILLFQLYSVNKEIKNEQKIINSLDDRLKLSEESQKNSLPRF
jgi:hypothetical protein